MSYSKSQPGSMYVLPHGRLTKISAEADDISMFSEDWKSLPLGGMPLIGSLTGPDADKNG
jgi:hypothetical protein